MRLVCDCHVHTISSGHAYSTIAECAKAACEKGIRLIAITDHGPAMPGGAHLLHFQNMIVLPQFLHGVQVLRGAEVNILDDGGSLDINDEVLETLDLVIASLHPLCYQPRSARDNTRGVVSVMKSRHVDIIGHPDDSRIPLDYEELARAAVGTGTMLEVNDSSLRPTAFRVNAERNLDVLLNTAKRLGARLIVNSDAHFHEDVGNLAMALSFLERHDIPEPMVAGTSAERLLSWLK
jgi:putative hydrolase